MRIASTPIGEWLETTPEMINALTRGKGLGTVHGLPVEHLCYKGVLICEHGKKEKIKEMMDEPLTNRLHGSTEARIVSGR